jgi:tripartite-type tricarboxylate transporter receptor subunit TctC
MPARGRRALLCLVGVLACCWALAAAAPAQTFPARPIRIIVPLAVGGGQDIMTRVVAAHLGEKLGQQVIVDNRPGGGGNIGMEAGARAAPDGYTLSMLNSGNMTINPWLYETLSVDSVRHFKPIMLVCRFYQYLIVNPAVPAKSLVELVAYAKQNPGKLTAGHAGLGGISYFAIEQFLRLGQIDVVSVPYKGAGPAIVDLLGGQISMVFTDLAGAGTPIAARQVIGMGTTAPRRRAAFPEMPAIGEVIPGYAMDGWYGLLAPAGAPEPVIKLLNATLADVLRKPEVQQRFADSDYEIVGGPPEDFVTVIERDMRRYGELVREYNIPKM